MIYDVQKIREILPHRYPLLLVDRITAITPNQALKHTKTLPLMKKFSMDTFRYNPFIREFISLREWLKQGEY